MKRSDDQKRRILDAGLRTWPNTSARAIGRLIGMSHSNVLYYFTNAGGLRDAIARHAVTVQDSRVIGHLIAEKHAAVSSMPDVERVAHMMG